MAVSRTLFGVLLPIAMATSACAARAKYAPADFASSAVPRAMPGSEGDIRAVTMSVGSAASESTDSFEMQDVPAGDLVASAPPAPPPPPLLPPAGTPVARVDEVKQAATPHERRLVIYKGSFVVLVPALEAAVTKLVDSATALAGYVESQSADAGANNVTLTLRVPAEKFQTLVAELSAYGQVLQKQLSATDVTKQVFDVELRLDVAEKSRQRLLDLLKSATKMEEILQIEAEVRRLTQEIEGMKGELRFLKDQVALATLAVTFSSHAPPPTWGPTRARSRFAWINAVGIDRVLQDF